MATVDVSDTTVSTLSIEGPMAERDEGGGVHNELCAVVMAMLGHDLRQPLQVIMTASETLAQSVWGSAERAQLTRIEAAVIRLAGTLDQFVEVLRLQEASIHLHEKPVLLRSILADLAAEFTGLAELRGIRLRVIPASAAVSSHPVLLKGILRNLMRNAIEYTPPGGRVVIGCRRRGSEAHIEVHDSGIGIERGELTEIFRAFHRVDGTRADGLGLGLFIVKHAAELLGHRVEVRSAAGYGSCFVVAAKAARSKAPFFDGAK